MARWCVGEEPECNGPECGHAEDCPYYHDLTQDDWARKEKLEKRKKDMEHTDEKNRPGDHSVASVCREMRETADENERLGFHDLRNLSTDSLRAWADIVEETPKNVKVDEDTSDGYHTFGELYRYRMLYNAAFFNMLARHTDIPVVKSHRHGDGELCFGGGWFIVMAQLPTGQVSNHYEDRFWELFNVPEAEKAPEWDGHTPNDAADRIEAFLKTRRPEKPESGGNAASMREALGRIGDCIEAATAAPQHADGYLAQIDKLASVALSSPARNCDVGTADEQQNRFREFCRLHDSKGECGIGRSEAACPAFHGWRNPDCSLWWAQMPYENKEESND